MKDNKTDKQIQNIIVKINKTTQIWMNQLNTITNNIEDNRKQGNFSFNIDRLERFVKGLNEFKK